MWLLNERANYLYSVELWSYKCQTAITDRFEHYNIPVYVSLVGLLQRCNSRKEIIGRLTKDRVRLSVFFFRVCPNQRAEVVVLDFVLISERM